MHPAPSSLASRGDVVLQPIYFTSSIYVKAIRDDLSMLILRYHEAYSQAGSPKPFALFKAVWMTMGWHWLHFKVFDSRSRQTFLEVTVRLFLERTVKTEAPFTRVVSLFAAYVFFYTQIKGAIPSLQQLVNIPIPYDHFESLMKMTDTTSQQCITLRPYVQSILSCLQKDQVFVILPQSDFGPMNPRDLPREIYAEDGIVFSDLVQKKKGRPARKEKGKKARLALDDLDELVSKIDQSPEDVKAALAGYQCARLTLLDRGDSLKEIRQTVLDRLNGARETVHSDTEHEGIQQVIADDGAYLNCLNRKSHHPA